jgi:hypothetical protein
LTLFVCCQFFCYRSLSCSSVSGPRFCSLVVSPFVIGPCCQFFCYRSLSLFFCYKSSFPLYCCQFFCYRSLSCSSVSGPRLCRLLSALVSVLPSVIGRRLRSCTFGNFR